MFESKHQQAVTDFMHFAMVPTQTLLAGNSLQPSNQWERAILGRTFQLFD